MALEDILRALEEKAEARIAEITSQADKQVEEVKTEVEREAARTKRIKLKKLKDSIRSEVNAVVYSTSLKAKNEIIKAQEETVDRAFEKAKETLLEMNRDPSYPEILEVLLDECLEMIDGEVELVVREDDRAVIERLMADRQRSYRLSQSPLEASGGLVAVSADGEITVFNTFEYRLRKAKDALKLEISNALFKA